VAKSKAFRRTALGILAATSRKWFVGLRIPADNSRFGWTLSLARYNHSRSDFEAGKCVFAGVVHSGSSHFPTAESAPPNMPNPICVVPSFQQIAFLVEETGEYTKQLQEFMNHRKERQMSRNKTPHPPIVSREQWLAERKSPAPLEKRDL
jgi:hypothetical protein